ncbi:MAG: hypothetical protein R3324_03665 [Halobacteriales archaeon]|nr:hypothetical protein [Halobacteriales archaeon]
MHKALTFLLLSASVTACGLATAASSVPRAPSYVMGRPDDSPVPPAPTAPESVDPRFCESSGAELLPALEGSWSIEQGAGLVWGATEQGSITMPLAGHDPVPVVLEYLPERGVMHVQNVGQEGDMDLFPATEAQLSFAEPLIEPDGDEDPAPSTPGCDWFESPLFIGTNYYVGEEEVTAEDATEWVPSCAVLSLVVPYFDPDWCRRTRDPSRSSFEMEMTVVLRFSGQAHASGMLYFEGSGESTEFGGGAPTETSSVFRAAAPVQLSR